MSLKKILIVFGTRPEAIKMAPLIHELNADSRFDLKICVTAQHREMLDDVLVMLEIKPDFDLNIMKPGNDLSEVTATILLRLPSVLEQCQPDIVLVHGDTTTSSIAAMVAYYKKIRVGHIEAGLRTNNIYSPWPEEVNRKITATIACYHFAPTETAKANLVAENNDENKIFVTGNTVVDALFWVLNKIENDDKLKSEIAETFTYLNRQKPIILVTGHRRESYGKGFVQICHALKRIASEHPECQIVYPAHLNPKVQETVYNLLNDQDNIYVIKPLNYFSFVYLMSISYFILTDSGGIQEEAPSLGKPVLVMRDHTERPEAVSAGTVLLTGTDADKIFDVANMLLVDKDFYTSMSKKYNPYGNGNASRIIISVLSKLI